MNAPRITEEHSKLLIHMVVRAFLLDVAIYTPITKDFLLPLNTRKIVSRLLRRVCCTGNGRDGTPRRTAALNWDSTALFHETQIQLSGVEFHFCPSCRLWSENSRFDSETSPVRLEKGLATSVDYRRIIASGLHFGGKTVSVKTTAS